MTTLDTQPNATQANDGFDFERIGADISRRFDDDDWQIIASIRSELDPQTLGERFTALTDALVHMEAASTALERAGAEGDATDNLTEMIEDTAAARQFYIVAISSAKAASQR
jgi:hypothetical protein